MLKEPNWLKGESKEKLQTAWKYNNKIVSQNFR